MAVSRVHWHPASPDDPVANHLQESCAEFLHHASLHNLLQLRSEWPTDMSRLRVYRADVDRPIKDTDGQDINTVLRYVWYKASPAWFEGKAWLVRMDHFIPHLPAKAFDSDRLYALLQSVLIQEHSKDQSPVTLFTTKSILPGGLEQMCRFTCNNSHIAPHAGLGFLDPLITSDIASSKQTYTDSITDISSSPPQQPPPAPALPASPATQKQTNLLPNDGQPFGRSQFHNTFMAANHLWDPFVSGPDQRDSSNSNLTLARANTVNTADIMNNMSPNTGPLGGGSGNISIEQRAQQLIHQLHDPNAIAIVQNLLVELQTYKAAADLVYHKNMQLGEAHERERALRRDVAEMKDRLQAVRDFRNNNPSA